MPLCLRIRGANCRKTLDLFRIKQRNVEWDMALAVEWRCRHDNLSIQANFRCSLCEETATVTANFSTDGESVKLNRCIQSHKIKSPVKLLSLTFASVPRPYVFTLAERDLQLMCIFLIASFHLWSVMLHSLLPTWEHDVKTDEKGENKLSCAKRLHDECLGCHGYDKCWRKHADANRANAMPLPCYPSPFL